MRNLLYKCMEDARGYSSIMRGVPLELMEEAKDLVTSTLNVNRSQLYTMYRGPRVNNKGNLVVLSKNEASDAATGKRR